MSGCIIGSMRGWIILIICLLVSGCGNFSDRKGGSTATEYVWLTRYDVKTLDPSEVQDWTTGKVLSYIYPSIGKLCDIDTKDNKMFRLKLHKSTFSNGDPVTGTDIRFTLERCLWRGSLSTVGNQFAHQIQGSQSFADGKSQHVESIQGWLITK
jgi:ABC-type transport system substrate-binding protein